MSNRLHHDIEIVLTLKVILKYFHYDDELSVYSWGHTIAYAYTCIPKNTWPDFKESY